MATPAKIDSANLPIIALVGRVNVGKSTLFNRLIEQDKAIVSKYAGTTRTSNEGTILWRGKYLKLIDTGGLTFDEDIPLEKEILAQSERAMKEADIIVFVADAQTGLLPQERELAKRLRRITHKPVIFVANKVDKNKFVLNLTEPEWHKMGLGEPFPVSAANGRNVGDFLDMLYSTLQKMKIRPKKNSTKEEGTINVSIIGKPNVGKSSIFNKLIGYEKVIVSPIAHTTREPHDTLITYEYEKSELGDIVTSNDEAKNTRPQRLAGLHGGREEKTAKLKQKINFVDTAGIRRKASVHGHLERAGIHKSIDMISESDIVLFTIDGAETISSQDRQLGGLLEKHSKSVIIIINKWDLSEDNTDHHRKEVKEMIYSYFPHLDYAPIIFVSGLTSYRVHDIFPMIIKAWQSRNIVIPDQKLKTFLKDVQRLHKPTRGKGVRQPEILGFHQIATNPPIFEASIKVKTSLHYSYVNFLARKLREVFKFFGTPVVIKLTKMKKI